MSFVQRLTLSFFSGLIKFEIFYNIKSLNFQIPGFSGYSGFYFATLQFLNFVVFSEFKVLNFYLKLIGTYMVAFL